ncbi:MAG: YIP1 family protein [bacterium]
MENTNQSDVRYDVYIDGLKDEDSKKQVIMFLAGVIKHIQLEDIIAGITKLPFKVVSAVTEQTALKLQERLAIRGAEVRLVQLVPGTFTPKIEQTITEPVQQPYASSSSISGQPFSNEQAFLSEKVGADIKTNITEQSYIKRLWTNWVDVMFNPASFFRSIDAEKQIPFPVIFGIVWGTIALILNIPTVLYTQQSYLKFFSEGMSSPVVIPFSSYFSIIVIAPFFLFIFLFIMAGIYHIFVLLVGGKGGFVSTLKVISYSIGAMVLEVIPFIGVPLFWFYSIYLYTIGFRELHKISSSRAFIASILPIILIVFFVIMLVILAIVGFGYSFLKQYRPPLSGIPI